jgi:iron complex outermembrane receptor protein
MAALHHTFRYGRSILLVGTALGLMPSIAAADEASATLENIVVTAQKREENLQVVPVAVTAVTAQALSAIRFTNVDDLNAIAPGVTVRETLGGDQLPVFTIRGVTATATPLSSSAVALYSDGVYVAQATGALFDLADVERVEVLRGPQGTLFGRNATAGAVNIITKEPSGKFQGHQEFSYGNLNAFRSKTSIDLPKWGLLSASVTYLHDERDGDIKNLGAGTVWHFGPSTDGRYGDRVSPKTLGAHDIDAVAATLKLETESGIKAVYRFNYTHNTFTNDGVTPASMATSFGFAFAPGYAVQNPAIRSPITTQRPDAVNNAYTTPGTLRVQTHALTITAPITDNISVKNILGFRKVHEDSTSELGGLGGLTAANFVGVQIPYPIPGLYLINGPAAGAAPTDPVLPIVNNPESDQKSFQEELQGNIDTKWVKSTVGYTHFYGHVIEGGFLNNYTTPFGVGLQGLAISALPYFNFTPAKVGVVQDRLSSFSDALYTQDELHVTSRIDVVGGVRWTKDRKTGIDGGATPPVTAITPISYNRHTWTYLGGVNVKVTDDIFAYGKYSTAFISGGQAANIEFAPATAKSWEAGVKADLFDHKLRANLAAFTVKYGQFQILTGPRNGCPPSAFPQVSLNAAYCVINGGDAKDDGFELEVAAVPMAGLTLEASTAFNDMRFTRVNAGLRASDGTYVAPQTPRWTASLAATYQGPDMDSLRGAHFFAHADMEYTSSQFPQASDPYALLLAVKIPATALVNARVGLGGFQVGATTIEVAGWVKNLTNNKSEAYAADLGADYAAMFQRARTYGVDLKVGF